VRERERERDIYIIQGQNEGIGIDEYIERQLANTLPD